jgi:hypothetical protein
MSINRHNYEEYFILYMDNELSNEDRRVVEQFLQQHPDLQEELDLLMQYKLTPDESVIYPAKEELLKINGSSPVTLSNYDEWLVLYTDNELTPAQKRVVETFAAAHLSVQKELELLQKTKLQPEAIVFPHKESLYRREEKVVRMPVRWWRAAAAVLILAFGLSAVLILNRKQNSGKEDMAKTENGQQKQPVNIIAKDKTPSQGVAEQTETALSPSLTTGDDNNTTNNPALNREKNPVVAKKAITVPDNTLPVMVPAENKKQETVAVTQAPSNNLPLPLDNPNIRPVQKDDAVASVKPDNKNELQKVLSDPIVTKKDPVSSDYVQTAYPGEQLEQPEGKKNKNRGIFRKIARTFEKRTNIDPTTDDNRLLVAGLSIKLK